VLLVFDQFEEFFLYHPSGLASFESFLAQICNRRNTTVHLVLSLRSDRLFLLDRLRRGIPNILQNLFLIDPLTRKGAMDAVRNPIDRYNDLHRTDISIEEALVDALVDGADEREIFQRLPFRGRGTACADLRGETKSRSRGAGRVVAPFLQLTLEALWQEDINALHGKMLRLSTLQRLAGAEPGVPARSLVGLLAQQHLDSTLEDRSTDERTICATLFDRMVTYSGGKVAITLPNDFRALLSDPQLEIAEKILDELSRPGRSCLVREIASDEPRQPGVKERRFEIVHDALAVPILDWIMRWRENRARADAAAREQSAAEMLLKDFAAHAGIERANRQLAEQKLAARRRSAKLVFLATTLVAAAATLIPYVIYRDKADAIQRTALFMQVDARPEFRERILVGLAALHAAGELSLPFLDTETIREELHKTLLRSPRFGGSSRGAGVDLRSNQFAQLVNAESPKSAGGAYAQLEITSMSEQKPPLILKGPSELDPGTASGRQSRSKKLQVQPGPEAIVSYVDDVTYPTVVSKGILYFQDDAHPGIWRSKDLADFLPSDFDNSPDYVWVEAAARAVQIIGISPAKNEMQVYRLRPSKSAEGELDFAIGDGSTKIAWAGDRFLPALSPWMAHPPRDRFAYLRWSDCPSSQQERQQLAVGEFAATDGTPVWQGNCEVLATLVRGTAAGGNSPNPPSLVFGDDGESVVLRRGKEIIAVPLGNGLGDGTVTPSFLTFSLPPTLQSSSPPSWVMRPPMAAVRIAAPAGPAMWRFALIGPGGLVLLEGAEDQHTHDLRLYQPWNSQSSADAEPARLLTGLPSQGGVVQLKFTTDGNFLIAQMPQWTDKTLLTRIWDLRDQWKQAIRAAEKRAAVVALGCRIAGIEGSNSLSPEERTWVDPNAPQPCLLQSGTR
jgi:hypothetical protein